MKYKVQIRQWETYQGKRIGGREVYRDCLEATDCSQAMEKAWSYYKGVNPGACKPNYILAGKPVKTLEGYDGL